VVALRDLYPSTSPHAQESLPVSAGHTLHWRAYGNPKGVPALFVHGGPGAGCFPNHACASLALIVTCVASHIWVARCRERH